MPTPSSYPPFDIPDVDLWSFMFETKCSEEFPLDKGTAHLMAEDTIRHVADRLSPLRQSSIALSTRDATTPRRV